MRALWLFLSLFMPAASSAADALGELARAAGDPAPAAPAPAGAPVEAAAAQPRRQPLDAARLREVVAALTAEEMGGRAPLSEGSRRARELIIERMRAAGLAPAGTDGAWTQPVEKAVFGNVIGHNVVGILRGRRNPGDCVYFDAHYDHWGRAGGTLQPGANDNASGVAIMLEAARVLAAEGTDRSVVFLASDFEEGAAMPMAGGLKGAAFHAENPACARGSIKAALVVDMLGGRFVPGMAPRLFLLGSESSREVYALARELARDPASPVPVSQVGIYAIEPAGPRVARADYGPFREQSVPFLFATSGIPPEYHTAQDTIDKLDFAYMAEAGGILTGLLRRLASAELRPSFAAEPDEVVDWAAETATLNALVDAVAAVRALRAEKGEWVDKLERDRRYLRDNLNRWSRPNRRIAIRRTMTNSVLALMKMNGALRLWDHLYRTH